MRLTNEIKQAIKFALLTHQGESEVPKNYLQKSSFSPLQSQWIGFKEHAKAAPKFLKRDGEALKIWLVLTEKKEINAFVKMLKAKSTNNYLLTFYVGTFSAIYNLFIRLINQKLIAIPIQNSRVKKNKASYQVNQGSTTQSYQKQALLMDLPIYTEAQDSSKPPHEYALLLISLALEFIYFHELTHIEHGHVEFMIGHDQHLHALFHNELIVGQQTNKLNMNRKAIEFEADMGAAEWMFDTYWFNEGLVYRGTLMRNFSRYIKSNADMFSAIANSLIWLFHLIEEIRISEENYNEKAYPSPGCRILTVYRILLIIAGRKSGNQELIYSCFLEALTQYTESCNRLKRLPLIKAGIFNTDSETFRELEQIDKHRLAILPLLKPYQFHRASELT